MNMTVTQLRKRLERIEADGMGDQVIVIRSNRYVSDKRKRDGQRQETSLALVNYAMTGGFKLHDQPFYTTELSCTAIRDGAWEAA